MFSDVSTLVVTQVEWVEWLRVVEARPNRPGITLQAWTSGTASRYEFCTWLKYAYLELWWIFDNLHNLRFENRRVNF